jgi:hypothetical protein
MRWKSNSKPEKNKQLTQKPKTSLEVSLLLFDRIMLVRIYKVVSEDKEL